MKRKSKPGKSQSLEGDDGPKIWVADSDDENKKIPTWQ